MHCNENYNYSTEFNFQYSISISLMQICPAELWYNDK